MTKNEHFEKLQLSIGINPIMPDKYPETFPLHWHQYIEVVALPHGACVTELPIVKINQNMYTLEPGDILFAWSGELHEIISNPDKQLIALQFPSSSISELQEFVPYLNAFRAIHQISNLTEPELSQNMMAQLVHMLNIKQAGQTFAGVENLICLYELFMTFGYYVKRLNKQAISNIAGCSPQTMEKMNQACVYISENCEQPLTLEYIANQFNFSIYYFSRIFKIATSFNFTEYLTLQRVKRAQMLLAESDLNITEIAFQSGFKSISSFNRAFRQFKGCSPSDYRKYHDATE